MRSLVRGVLLATALMVHPSIVGATAIEYQVTHLGADTWQYDYFITAGTFAAQQGFVVVFDDSPTLYASLQPVLPSPTDWDVLVTDPQPALLTDGGYDALALVDNPLFTGPFGVTFTWLGLPGTTPGAQAFYVYSLDASGAPVVTERGVAAPGSVPEPSALLLVAVAAGWRLRVRRRTPRSI